MRTPKILIISTLVILFAGCSAKETDEQLTKPEKEIYSEALAALEGKHYSLAIKKLQLLEARYPFGNYSQQAQLELVYAHFKNNEPAAARAAADRFIRLHPNHERLDYAHYLKGLTAFEQDRSLVLNYLPLDESKRDPGAAIDAFDSFQTLLNLYPNSEYAYDSRKRMIYLKNRLARYEVHVARYYIKRGAYLAAANRGRYVIERFQTTPAIPDALAVMIEAYTLLEQKKLADTATLVLKTNFPDYAYKPIKKPAKGLLDAITFDVFRDDES